MGGGAAAAAAGKTVGSLEVEGDNNAVANVVLNRNMYEVAGGAAPGGCGANHMSS